MLIVALAAAAIGAQRADPFGETATDLVREPAIGYFTNTATDPVARLKARVDRGELSLAFDAGSKTGYLRAVLDALAVPVDSQVLVYSKSSVQSLYINPRNPRALYFNDAVTVGFIRGAPLLELAAQDPKEGVVFYTVNQSAEGRPAIERRDFCLSCHYGLATSGVPGMLVRSIVTSPTGSTLPQLGNYVIDHRSPFEQRWGGYYVTGRHGAARHLGNALVDRANPEVPAAAAQNLTSLADRFDSEAYPSANSDIVALLAFDHQMRMMNLLTRVGWEVRIAEAADRDAAAVARELAVPLVDYMLFIDEAPLPTGAALNDVNDVIKGTTTFAATFAARGPKDRRGRSLRQLGLAEGRLLRYPCSYLIYSEAFDALPPTARDAVHRRLWEVLSSPTGNDSNPRYRHLSGPDRRAIVEILRDTKGDLPAYFH